MSGLPGYKVDKYGIAKPIPRRESVDKERLTYCPYCGDIDVPRYPHRPSMCVTCGQRYETFRKLNPSSARYKEIVAYYDKADLNGLKTPTYRR